MCLDKYELRVGLNYDRFQENLILTKMGTVVQKAQEKKQHFVYCWAARLLCQNSHYGKVGWSRNVGLALLDVCMQQSTVA